MRTKRKEKNALVPRNICPLAKQLMMQLPWLQRWAQQTCEAKQQPARRRAAVPRGGGRPGLPTLGARRLTLGASPVPSRAPRRHHGHRRQPAAARSGARRLPVPRAHAPLRSPVAQGVAAGPTACDLTVLCRVLRYTYRQSPAPRRRQYSVWCVQFQCSGVHLGVLLCCFR